MWGFDVVVDSLEFDGDIIIVIVALIFAAAIYHAHSASI